VRFIKTEQTKQKNNMLESYMKNINRQYINTLPQGDALDFAHVSSSNYSIAFEPKQEQTRGMRDIGVLI
jgi:hypothetical protein